MAQSKGALSVGVRLHDLPEGTVEERIRMAGKLGFSCIQLPSKVLYKSFGINRSGLTHELADHLREVLDTNGVQVAVLDESGVTVARLTRISWWIPMPSTRRA